MKAKNYSGTIKTFPNVPKSYGSIIGGFDLLSDSELESYGFYDVIIPSYDASIKEVGAIEWDASNSVFTYPVSNKTWTETLAELKVIKIAEAKSIANSMLAKTDWYIIRKSEKDLDIPEDLLLERDAIRSSCNSNEGGIDACTTKASVVSYVLTW